MSVSYSEQKKRLERKGPTQRLSHHDLWSHPKRSSRDAVFISDCFSLNLNRRQTKIYSGGRRRRRRRIASTRTSSVQVEANIYLQLNYVPQTLTTLLASSRRLLGLRSRWMICGFERWSQLRPNAVSLANLTLR